MATNEMEAAAGAADEAAKWPGSARLGRALTLDGWRREPTRIGDEYTGGPNERALAIGAFRYTTYVSPCGHVRVAFDSTQLYVREERSGVYMGDPSATSPGHAVLAGIVTDPEHRHAGYATTALRAVARHADALGVTIQLEPCVPKNYAGKRGTHCPSKRLVKWYHKLGWTPERQGDERILTRTPGAIPGVTYVK